MVGSSWITGRKRRNSGGRKGASSPPKVKAGGVAEAGSTGSAQKGKTGGQTRRGRQRLESTGGGVGRVGMVLQAFHGRAISPCRLRGSCDGAAAVRLSKNGTHGEHDSPVVSSGGKTGSRNRPVVETAEEFRPNPTMFSRIASTASRPGRARRAARNAETSTSGAGLFTEAAPGGADWTRRLL